MPAEQRQAKRAKLRHVTAKLLLENVKSKDFLEEVLFSGLSGVGGGSDGSVFFLKVK